MILVINLQISYQQNNTFNGGPSTSTEDISATERCELLNYAGRLLTLLLAEDSSDVDLTEMAENRFDELTAFHDEVFTYVVLARFGAQNMDDRARRHRRLAFFTHHLALTTLNMMAEHCTTHYSYDMVYEYNRPHNMILVRKNVSYQPDSCLCGNYRERSSLDVPFVIPHVERPDLTVQVEIDRRNRLQIAELNVYHIIPLPLITKFFETWVSNESTNVDDTNFSNCVRTLFYRLRRSMRKLLLASLGRSLLAANSNAPFSELIERSHGMLSGNIFLGPINRGPFSPEFQRNHEEAFEFGLVGTYFSAYTCFFIKMV